MKLERFSIILGFVWCILFAFLLFMAMTACTVKKRDPVRTDKNRCTIRKTSVLEQKKIAILDTVLTVQDLTDTFRVEKENVSVFVYSRNEEIHIKTTYSPKPRDKLHLVAICMLIGCIWLITKVKM